MPRAQWVVGVLTVTLLLTGIGVLRATEGAGPTAPTAGDALPSRVLGLSGPRRVARQLEHSGGHTTGGGSQRPLRSGITPLPAARPLRLVIRSLGVDVPLTGGTPGAGAGGTDHGLGRDREDAKDPEDDGYEGGGAYGGDGAVWGAAGPAPGTAGTAEVYGNFQRLSELRRGQTIEIPRADRRTAVFTVYRVSPTGVAERNASGKARLRLMSGETAVLARLTGHRRSPR
ncbi:hypothetical protein ABZY44_26500 [Streptomyces sp. NPDC006544]|uniref:hypothetical protein n=1 Tax=Streptomyces sp. NPDC006544 TaxID=3154583 RepID=UPI00339EA153